MDRGLAAVAVAAIAMMAIAVGCGDSSSGSNDSGSSSDSALTKAEYVKQGNAICRKGVNERTKIVAAIYEEKAKENGGKKVGLSRAEEEELVVEKALPPIRKAVEGLAALTPPEGDEDTVNTFVEGLEEAVEKTEEDPGNVVGASGSSFNVFEEPKEEASDYGLEDCRALA